MNSRIANAYISNRKRNTAEASDRLHPCFPFTWHQYESASRRAAGVSARHA